MKKPGAKGGKTVRSRSADNAGDGVSARNISPEDREAVRICMDNISSQLPAFGELSVGIYSHLRDAASLIAESCGSAAGNSGEIFSLFADIASFSGISDTPRPQETRNPFFADALRDEACRTFTRQTLSGLRNAAAVALCRLAAVKIGGDDCEALIARLSGACAPRGEIRLIVPPGAGALGASEIFAAALRAGSGERAGVTIAQRDDFSEVAQEVGDGESDFAVLPVSSSSEGLLTTFRLLASRYDLRLCMTCPRTSPDGSVTVYGLYSKCFPVLECGGERFVSVVLPPRGDDSATACELLSAAEAIGLPLCRLSALPISYSENEFASELTFHIPSPSLLAEFLLYLASFCPACVLSGLYNQLAT